MSIPYSKTTEIAYRGPGWKDVKVAALDRGWELQVLWNTKKLNLADAVEDMKKELDEMVRDQIGKELER